MIKPDSKLQTVEELTDRIKSIDAQRERFCSSCSPALRYADAFIKNQKKIARLTERESALWARRADLLNPGGGA